MDKIFSSLSKFVNAAVITKIPSSLQVGFFVITEVVSTVSDKVEAHLKQVLDAVTLLLSLFQIYSVSP